MKPKKLPRLWCALQGLLPLEACLAAQRGELAWPRGATAAMKIPAGSPLLQPRRRNGVAVSAHGRDVAPYVPVRNKG